MKNIKKIVAACLLGTLVVTTAGCASIEKTQAAIDKTVIAKVNDEEITRKDLDSDYEVGAIIEKTKEQYGENYKDNKEAMEYLKSQKSRVLENMILEKILVAETEKRELMPTDEEISEGVNQQIEAIKSQYDDEAKYLEDLKAQGASEEILKNYFEKTIIFKKLQEDILKDVKVSEEEVKNQYDKYKDKYPADNEDPTMLALSHILVATEDEAKEVKKKLDDGATFADMAKEYGTDGTKDNGGELGEVPANTTSFDADFMNGALVLKEGEISDPVKTQFGYHLIQCTSRKEKPAKAFEEAKEYIEYELLIAKQNEAVNVALEELKENANIKKYEDKLI
ncbi:peptidylprolyl isomerase [Clostridium sediminicola]|uniref:peptidylprolyl isomerase n=1 Tax=Clostridium sediminicola TaxID=3114879 RepID=UPI0031F1D948